MSEVLPQKFLLQRVITYNWLKQKIYRIDEPPAGKNWTTFNGERLYYQGKAVYDNGTTVYAED